MLAIGLQVLLACETRADCSVLDNLIGWTLLGATAADSADLKRVADGESDVAVLKNGMIFRFPKEQYLVGQSRYKALDASGNLQREKIDVFVFVRPPRPEMIDDARKHGISIEDVEKYDLDVPWLKPDYMLVIDDQIYAVNLVKSGTK